MSLVKACNVCLYVIIKLVPSGAPLPWDRHVITERCDKTMKTTEFQLAAL